MCEVIQFPNPEKRCQNPDAAGPRGDAEPAVIIIMPVIRIERTAVQPVNVAAPQAETVLMAADDFYAVLTAAIDDLVTHGFDSIERVRTLVRGAARRCGTKSDLYGNDGANAA